MISLRDVVTGFGNRDPLAEVWRRDLRGGGSAEITGTLPLYYNAKGTPLTDYLISGNTIQNGTPSPDMPVDVVGCGVMTWNLFDISTVEKGRIDGGVVGYASATTDLTITGNKIEFTTAAKYRGVCVGFIEIPNGAESISFYGTFRGGNGIGKKLVFYDAQKMWLNADVVFGSLDGSGTTTIPNGAKFIRMSYTAQESGTASISNFMLNTGSTALPYEPYGYKLPLTVNGTEYPIYLGTVPATRKIGKLVLDGMEAVTKAASNPVFTIPIGGVSVPYNETGVTTLSTHYLAQNNVSGTGNVADMCICIRRGYGTMYIGDTRYDNAADFKSFLATQYANGTPVTVWYVLAEPETAVVNEPLMKIGDYADTISFAQAGVTIPTVNGANVLDTTSTVKPSEVYIKGRGIKPKGYGQLVDKNDVRILDKNGTRIFVHGQ